jgi:hypothetical protein
MSDSAKADEHNRQADERNRVLEQQVRELQEKVSRPGEFGENRKKREH